MKFAIGIPTLNRRDLLEPSLIKYKNDFPYTEIHVVDNGKQDIGYWYALNDYIKVSEQETNLGVAGSWNYLCDRIFQDNDYALIINDDIYLGFGIGTISEVYQSEHDGFIQSEHNFSVFLISKEFYQKIGKFDEFFYPAYYEDSDYIRRIELSNLKRVIDKRLNPKIALTSQTYEKAPDLVNKALKDSKERYIRKWGGLPLMETYTLQFDGNSTLLDILDLRDQQDIITKKIDNMSLEKYNRILNSTLKHLIRYDIPYFKSSSIESNCVEFFFSEKINLEQISDLAEKIKKNYEIQSFIIDGNFFNGIKLILFI
jgi:hypothetical protein